MKLYLNVTAVLLCIFVSCPVLQAQRTCDMFYRGWNSTCCDGEKYFFPYGEEDKEACRQISPHDATLSYEDSVWLLYGCIVNKTMGPKLLTLESYFDMMSRNLSEPKRESMRKYLESSTLPAPHIAFADDTSTAKTMRLYFNAYFDAEYETCNPPQTKSPNNGTRQRKRDYSKPVFNCRNTSLPLAISIDYGYGEDSIWNKFRKCINSTQEQFASTNERVASFFAGAMYQVCSLRSRGLKPDLSGKFDFEEFIYSQFPKYVSKLTRQELKGNVTELLAKKYPNAPEAGDLNEIAPLIKAEFDAKLKNKTLDGYEVKNLEMYRTAYVLNRIIYTAWEWSGFCFGMLL